MTGNDEGGSDVWGVVDVVELVSDGLVKSDESGFGCCVVGWGQYVSSMSIR